MKRIIMVIILTSTAIFSSMNAQALAILLEPPPGEILKIHPHEIIRVDVNVVGLHAAVPDSDIPAGVDMSLAPFRANAFLAAFGFDLLFDPSVLAFSLAGSSPGPALGSPSQGEAFYDLDESTPGIVRLLGVSFLEESASSCLFCIAPYLDQLQSDGNGAPLNKLRLATLAFVLAGNQGVLPESTRLTLNDAVLADPLGNEIALLDRNGVAVHEGVGQPITATTDPVTGFLRAEGAVIAIGVPDTLSLLFASTLAWRLLRTPHRRARRQSW